MPAPLVSIIIPTHNRAHTLNVTLGSVVAQSESAWECLVVDDHSTDETDDLIERFSQEDGRIHHLQLTSPARGTNAARNLGLARAQGNFVIFLDSDDALGVDCLKQRIEAMAGSPDLDFGVFPTLLFQEKPGDESILWNVETSEDDLDRFLRLDIPWQTAGVFWRKSALARMGPWREKLPGWQDWEFHLRALIRNLKYERLGEPDSYWRRPRADSIWSQAKDPAHLRARVNLLGHIVRELRQARRLGPRQKRLLAGLYFWHGRLWYLRSRDRLRAGATWAQACGQGLIGPVRFLEGLRWFSRITRGKSQELRVVFPSWPMDYFLDASSTFQQMRYPRTAS